jgi:hypothetical protein
VASGKKSRRTHKMPRVIDQLLKKTESMVDHGHTTANASVLAFIPEAPKSFRPSFAPQNSGSSFEIHLKIKN